MRAQVDRLTEAVEQLGVRQAALGATCATSKKAAARLAAEGRKAEALTELRKSKIAEAKVSKTANMIASITAQADALQSVSLNTAVVNAMRDSASTLKQYTKISGGVDAVDKLADDLADQMASHTEMTDALADPLLLGSSINGEDIGDDDALEAELQAMIDSTSEDCGEPVAPVVPVVPVGQVGRGEQKNNSRGTKGEEEEIQLETLLPSVPNNPPFDPVSTQVPGKMSSGEYDELLGRRQARKAASKSRAYAGTSRANRGLSDDTGMDMDTHTDAETDAVVVAHS